MLIFRLLRLAFFLTTLAAVVAIGGVAFLLLEGGADPPECAAGAPSGFEQAARSLAFDAKLATYLATAGRIPGMTLEIDETEAAARAMTYLEDRTGRVSDIAICFRDGRAEAFARVDTPIGRRVGVRAEGTLDLSGEHPRLRIESAGAGLLSTPAFLRGELEDAINQELQDIRLTAPLVLIFSEGRASLSLR